MQRRPELDTAEIRALVAHYDGPALIRDTIPALCDEVEALRFDNERLHRMAYLTIRKPSKPTVLAILAFTVFMIAALVIAATVGG